MDSILVQPKRTFIKTLQQKSVVIRTPRRQPVKRKSEILSPPSPTPSTFSSGQLIRSIQDLAIKCENASKVCNFML